MEFVIFVKKDARDTWLKHDIWNSVILKKDRRKLCCISCLEFKLNRDLTEKDFILTTEFGDPLPINCGFFGFDAELFIKLKNVN